MFSLSCPVLARGVGNGGRTMPLKHQNGPKPSQTWLLLPSQCVTDQFWRTAFSTILWPKISHFCSRNSMKWGKKDGPKWAKMRWAKMGAKWAICALFTIPKNESKVENGNCQRKGQTCCWQGCAWFVVRVWLVVVAVLVDCGY